MIRMRQQISDLEIDLAKRKYWPELSLVGAATYGSSEYLDTNQTWADNEASQWSVLLNLKFNILDWGVRNHVAKRPITIRRIFICAGSTGLPEVQLELDKRGLLPIALDLYLYIRRNLNEILSIICRYFFRTHRLRQNKTNF